MHTGKAKIAKTLEEKVTLIQSLIQKKLFDDASKSQVRAIIQEIMQKSSHWELNNVIIAYFAAAPTCSDEEAILLFNFSRYQRVMGQLIDSHQARIPFWIEYTVREKLPLDFCIDFLLKVTDAIPDFIFGQVTIDFIQHQLLFWIKDVAREKRSLDFCIDVLLKVKATIPGFIFDQVAIDFIQRQLIDSFSLMAVRAHVGLLEKFLDVILPAASPLPEAIAKLLLQVLEKALKKTVEMRYQINEASARKLFLKCEQLDVTGKWRVEYCQVLLEAEKNDAFRDLFIEFVLSFVTRHHILYSPLKERLEKKTNRNSNGKAVLAKIKALPGVREEELKLPKISREKKELPAEIEREMPIIPITDVDEIFRLLNLKEDLAILAPRKLHPGSRKVLLDAVSHLVTTHGAGNLLAYEQLATLLYFVASPPFDHLLGYQNNLLRDVWQLLDVALQNLLDPHGKINAAVCKYIISTDRDLASSKDDAVAVSPPSLDEVRKALSTYKSIISAERKSKSAKGKALAVAVSSSSAGEVYEVLSSDDESLAAGFLSPSLAAAKNLSGVLWRFSKHIPSDDEQAKDFLKILIAGHKGIGGGIKDDIKAYICLLYRDKYKGDVAVSNPLFPAKQAPSIFQNIVHKYSNTWAIRSDFIWQQLAQIPGFFEWPSSTSDSREYLASYHFRQLSGSLLIHQPVTAGSEQALIARKAVDQDFVDHFIDNRLVIENRTRGCNDRDLAVCNLSFYRHEKDKRYLLLQVWGDYFAWEISLQHQDALSAKVKKTQKDTIDLSASFLAVLKPIVADDSWQHLSNQLDSADGVAQWIKILTARMNTALTANQPKLSGAPEAFCHNFVHGYVAAAYHNDYDRVRSNKTLTASTIDRSEAAASSNTRPDMMLISKDKQHAVIIEFKYGAESPEAGIEQIIRQYLCHPVYWKSSKMDTHRNKVKQVLAVGIRFDVGFGVDGRYSLSYAVKRFERNKSKSDSFIEVQHAPFLKNLQHIRSDFMTHPDRLIQQMQTILEKQISSQNFTLQSPHLFESFVLGIFATLPVSCIEQLPFGGYVFESQDKRFVMHTVSCTPGREVVDTEQMAVDWSKRLLERAELRDCIALLFGMHNLHDSEAKVFLATFAIAEKPDIHVYVAAESVGVLSQLMSPVSVVEASAAAPSRAAKRARVGDVGGGSSSAYQAATPFFKVGPDAMLTYFNQLFASWYSNRKVEGFSDPDILQIFTKAELEAEEQLHAVVMSCGFALKDVPGDGNCFFHALLDQITARCPGLTALADYLDWDHADLRNLAVERLSQLCNQGKLADFSANPEAMVKRAAEDRSWADDFTISTAAAALNITIVLINNDGNPPTIIDGGREAIVYLGYEVGCHFQSTTGEPSAALLQLIAQKRDTAVAPAM